MFKLGMGNRSVIFFFLAEIQDIMIIIGNSDLKHYYFYFEQKNLILSYVMDFFGQIFFFSILNIITFVETIFKIFRSIDYMKPGQ